VYVTVFNFKLRRGAPIFDQVVFASIGSMLRGEYQAGQAFPSVRTIASELKIHPNTAHKVIQFLVEEKWLETRPGIGTVVADRPKAKSEEWRRLLRNDVERLLVRAHSLDVGLPNLVDELNQQWSRLDQVRRTQ